MTEMNPLHDESAAPSTPRPASFYLLLAAGLFVLVETFSVLSPILLAFILILLISLAANPLIARLRKLLSGGRTVATGLAVAMLIALLGLTGWVFSKPISAAVVGLSVQLPAYWERLQRPLIKLEKKAKLSDDKLQADVASEIALDAAVAGEPMAAQAAREQESARRTAAARPPDTKDQANSLRSGLAEVLKGVVGGFKSVAFNTAQIMIVLVTVLFGVAFTLMNPRPIIGAMFAAVPERHHSKMLIIARRIGTFVSAWARATLLGMLSIALLVFLLMWPIFGFMDALMLGLIAGMFEVIPFLGPLLAAVPALLLALGEGGMTPLWVLLAYLTVQALENNVILPAIMARGMQLHPVAVIFSMLLCVVAFGVLGVLIAAPMVAIVDILHDELYRKRFLPSVTNADLDNLARMMLNEERSLKD